MRAVNLIPAENRPGGGGTYGRSEGAAYVLTGFVAGVALLVFLYVSAQHQIAQRQGTSARLNAQAQTATAQAAALAPYTSFISLRNQRLTAVEQLAGARFDWAHAFHELGRVLPLDVALQSVTGTIGGSASGTSAPAPAAPAAGATGATGATGAAGSTAVSAAQSATPPGSVPTINLAGCTTSQTEVAKTLQRLQLIDGVTDVELTSAAKKSAASAGGPVAPAGGSTTAPCPVNFSLKIDYAPLPTVTLTGGTVGGGTPDSSQATGAAAAVPLLGPSGTTGTTGPTGSTGATGPASPTPATPAPSSTAPSQ